MEFERRRYHTHLDIAPLVDIVFNLLLFFMLTSHLIEEPAIKIRLPDSTTAESTREISQTLTITKNGELYFMDKRVDLKNLRVAIQDSLPDKEKGFLRIKADKEVDVGLLVSVIDEVRLAGVKGFSVVTKMR
ncbi:MAG TPA: biopolymer transporter ExbD [Desulfurella acetivorans]|uniref:Biopolymer transporter ExbD n=1 Tax=Desulfurella acetivorans TaxID=33002 RepID=A0A7C6EAZ6_DESAE|nr:biopolymer transporter ExbD [Desulfurella acetivorans]